MNPRAHFEQFSNNRPKRLRQVRLLTRRFQIDPQSAVLAAGIQVVLEPLGAGGFSNLPTATEGEELAALNEFHNLAEPSFGRKHVVFRRITRSGDIELGPHAPDLGTAGASCQQTSKVQRPASS